MSGPGFCMSCGGKLQEGVKFCSSCGAARGTSKSKSANKKEKTTALEWIAFLAVAAIIILILVGIFIAIKSDKTASSGSTISNTTQTAPATSAKSSSSGGNTSDTTKTAPAAPVTDTKTEAEMTLGKFDGILHEMNNVNDIMGEIVTGIHDGVDPSALNDDLSELYSQTLIVKKNATNLQVPDRYAEHKKTLIAAVTAFQSSILDLKSYLSTNDQNDLTKWQNDTDQTSNDVEKVGTGVLAQAKKDGYQTSP